ncbi:MAG: GNAT family N-acetyltransferase [Planctomycetes bacterium]|nr:GNAT family N-acetyltransferase [Planctomycetota bacterium]
MSDRPPFTERPLHADDDGAATLAARAGPHGVYVTNALAAGDAAGFVLARGGEDAVLGWFGVRGNLVLIGPDTLGPAEVERVADQVQRTRRPWRIAMGPRAIVEALLLRTSGAPLVLRDQVYYAGSSATAAADQVRNDVRPAQRADRDRLVQATLQLNASDLNIPPASVDRRWLRDAIDERIAEGTTRVVGPVGGVTCKLDIGSDGPGGTVLEGVFTFADQRGRGLATGLVATCLAAAPASVCLHVGLHNTPARAAYERAGMQEVARCRLLLLG